MILINNGKIIGPNASLNGWKQPARPVIYFNNKGHLKYEVVKGINELSDKLQNIIWAVGGGSLIPYRPSENWGRDVTRSAQRTALATKDGKVYLIATKLSLNLNQLSNRTYSTIKPDTAIFLDGGGSTSMYYNGPKVKSSRSIDNGIFVKS